MHLDGNPRDLIENINQCRCRHYDVFPPQRLWHRDLCELRSPVGDLHIGSTWDGAYPCTYALGSTTDHLECDSILEKRQIDALFRLVIAGIGLSLVAFFGSGSFRALELREHLVSGVMGLVFLGSVVIKRPVLAAVLRSIMQRKSQAEAENLQSRFGDRRR